MIVNGQVTPRAIRALPGGALRKLAASHSGEMAAPFVSEAGLELIGRCDKKVVVQTAYVMPSREDVENQLFQQQISAMARRYMRDLRRGVDVEVR